MILSRGAVTLPVNPIILGNNTIKIVRKTKLLGYTIDNKLNWNEQMGELKLCYVN